MLLNCLTLTPALHTAKHPAYLLRSSRSHAMPLRVSDNLTFPRMRCALYSNAFKEKYIMVATAAQHIGPSAAWVQTPSHLVKQLDLSLCGVCNSGLPASAGLLTTLW